VGYIKKHQVNTLKLEQYVRPISDPMTKTCPYTTYELYKVFVVKHERFGDQFFTRPNAYAA